MIADQSHQAKLEAEEAVVSTLKEFGLDEINTFGSITNKKEYGRIYSSIWYQD